MENVLIKMLMVAFPAICLLHSGCASTLPRTEKNSPEQSFSRITTQPLAPTHRLAAAPASQQLSNGQLSPAVYNRNNYPVPATPLALDSPLTPVDQGNAVQPPVVHLAGPAFDPDIPTVGSFATLQTFCQEPEAVVAREAAIPTDARTDQRMKSFSAQAESSDAASASTTRAVVATPVGEYVIETGDSLDIKFRKTPELDNVVTVRPDGLVSLEIVGDVPAAGLTVESMRQELQLVYGAELNNPDIAVIVRSFSGNSIYIGGEVYAPGRVPLTGRITTLNAIILAGGFKDTADKERVVVQHGDGTCCEYDLKSVIECRGSGQNIQLRPYDVVYVPKSKIAKVNLFVEQYIDKVLPFSRSFGIFVSHNTGITSAVGN